MYGLNLIFCGRLREAVRFVYKHETEEVFQPKKLALDKTGMITETVTYLLAGKNSMEQVLCLFYIGGI